MIGLELNDTVVMEHKKLLEEALTTNPDTAERIRKLIRTAILDAREDVVSAASAAMKTDPRGAAKAVRTSVYRKILGANINIYNSKKAHGSTSYEPPRTLTAGQRGGNRRTRSGRTAKVMGYEAKDRGFILRFISDGVGEDGRNINFTSNDKRKADKWNKNPNTGNRGSVSARNWFSSAASSAMVKAIDNISNMIDDELNDIFRSK